MKDNGQERRMAGLIFLGFPAIFFAVSGFILIQSAFMLKHIPLLPCAHSSVEAPTNASLNKRRAKSFLCLPGLKAYHSVPTPTRTCVPSPHPSTTLPPASWIIGEFYFFVFICFAATTDPHPCLRTFATGSAMPSSAPDPDASEEEADLQEAWPREPRWHFIPLIPSGLNSACLHAEHPERIFACLRFLSMYLLSRKMSPNEIWSFLSIFLDFLFPIINIEAGFQYFPEKR